MQRQGFTRVELLCALALVAVLGVVVIPAAVFGHAAAQRGTCQENLKQFAAIFAMYSSEQRGEYYPPLYLRKGGDSGGAFTISLMPDPAVLYPDYLKDPAIYFCPAGASAMRAQARNTPPDEVLALLESPAARRHSYVYFGYVMDKADNVAGWTVPMSFIRPALEVFGITPPPGDDPIPAQCAAWLMQLAENAQATVPGNRIAEGDLIFPNYWSFPRMKERPN